MYYVNKNASVPVLLSGSGLTFNDVTAKLKKPTGISFDTLTLDEDTFQSAGENYYNVLLSDNLLPEPGTYVLLIDDNVIQANVQMSVALPVLGQTPPPDVAVLVGSIKDISGAAPITEQVAIEVKSSDNPTQSGGHVLLGKLKTWHADALGNFAVPVARGARITFAIPACGVRFQYTVPLHLDTINVNDLLANM